MVNVMWICGAKVAVTLCYTGIKLALRNRALPSINVAVLALALSLSSVLGSDRGLDENETSGVWEWRLLLPCGMFRF